ncbi:MAG: hypothetical protein KO202_00410 [Methanobacteriaceae archaeon]|jgi:hypothetical protein|nr:hypothetical protein [Methanobacteriaceae archaeon]
MKRWLIAILILILILVLAFLSSTVLFLAEDETEGVPGVDMAAIWKFPGGFEWIYPGSSFNTNGHTLHNIHLEEEGDPYQHAKAIIQNTYNITPNICIVINNAAAERIFGEDILGNIREHDWGEGHDRGDAVEMSMTQFNIFGAIESLIHGDIRIFLI